VQGFCHIQGGLSSIQALKMDVNGLHIHFIAVFDIPISDAHPAIFQDPPKPAHVPVR
jgi:hypothetical protein